MKEIKIKGQTFQYDATEGDYDEFTSPSTCFYQGTEVKTFKKFWFFGETLTKEVPKLVFSLPINIESTDYTKSYIRVRIEKELELLNRHLEIEKGEII